jgi:hypothetical protein
MCIKLWTLAMYMDDSGHMRNGKHLLHGLQHTLNQHAVRLSGVLGRQNGDSFGINLDGKSCSGTHKVTSLSVTLPDVDFHGKSRS